MQKDNEKAVSEMKQLAESFEKEVTEEGELEPSARCAGSTPMRSMKTDSLTPTHFVASLVLWETSLARLLSFSFRSASCLD